MTAEREQVVRRLTEAVRRLEACTEFALLVPEVRVNVAFSVPEPATVNDVAAVDGRITVVAGRPRASGPVRFGASDHMARLILEVRRHDSAFRAGMNFRWHETIHDYVTGYCRERAIATGVIDRTAEPDTLIGKDRGSIPWKVRHLAAATGGRIPPLFHESRGWGKEPLYFMLDSEPVELVERMIEIAAGFARQMAR